MGSSPRSYGYRFNWGGLLTPAIKILLIANTAVFLVQTLVQLILGPQAHRWLIEWFGLMPRGVTHGLRVWQPITLPMRAYVAIMGAIEFFGTLGATGDNISHISHLGGMLVGYLYLRRGSFLYRMRNRLSDWKRRRMRRKFEVYVRDHQDKPPSRPDHWVN